MRSLCSLEIRIRISNLNWTILFCIKRQSNSWIHFRIVPQDSGHQCAGPCNPLPILFRSIWSRLEDKADLSSPLQTPSAWWLIVLFHFHQLSFILPSQHCHGLVCGSSTLLCLAANRPQTLPSFPPTQPVKLVLHFVCFFTFSIFLCLSTHLSSQRILHWSNECTNSACCIKCGHPNKLHPLQGIRFAGSEAMLASHCGAKLHRFTCSCQSPEPITAPEVEVLNLCAVFLSS